jgi:hypothetical protein
VLFNIQRGRGRTLDRFRLIIKFIRESIHPSPLSAGPVFQPRFFSAPSQFRFFCQLFAHLWNGRTKSVAES